MKSNCSLNNSGYIQLNGESKSVRHLKKRSKKRKKSDPTVTNISVLLSSGLNIVSPKNISAKPEDTVASSSQVLGNSKSKNGQQESDDVLTRNTSVIFEKPISCLEKLCKSNTDYCKQLDENNQRGFGNTENCLLESAKQVDMVQDKATKSHSETENVELVLNTQEKEIDTKFQSKNAFQFMMESRNKVIGHNSPGKEMDNSNRSISCDNKDKLRARKELLGKWAVMKGSKKRKIEDTEREIYVKQQLEKRHKKMKRMLGVNENKVRKNSRRSNTVSDSEDIQDIVLINEIEDKIMEDKIDNLNGDRNYDNNQKLMRSNEDVHNQLDKIVKCTVSNIKEGECNNAKYHETNDLRHHNSGRSNLDTYLRKLPSANKKEKLVEEDEFESNENVNKDNVIKIKMFSPTVFTRKKRVISNHGIHNFVPKPKFKTHKHEADKEKRKGKSENTMAINLLSMESENEYEEGSASRDGLIGHINNEYRNEEQIQCATLTSNRKTRGRRSLANREIIESVTLDDSSSSSIIENASNNRRRSLRKRKSNLKYNDSATIHLEDSGSDDSNDKKIHETSKNDKPVKLAPIFHQRKSKQKIDPLVLEARKQFLMSGIPDALKRTMEKQQSFEELEVNLFPEISHIQQKTQIESGIDYWNLPKVNINMIEVDISIPKLAALESGTLNLFRNTEESKTTLSPLEKIENLKSILLEIKRTNPDYPVFRSFRLLKEKSDQFSMREPLLKHKKKKRSSHSKKQSQSEMDNNYGDSVMWTEKYKATTYDDLIGNQNAVTELKRWLQNWVDASENQSAISKRRDSSSNEFDCDSKSCDSATSLGNAVLLYGPHGSGKTMSIYALCSDLKINVLELNASSKRTGKRLLQELQEATQSHQVGKNDISSLSNYFRLTDDKQKDYVCNVKAIPNKNSKMCLLLVEDIDIVFEQDDGFLGALTQLLSTSKRPIILTATDTSSSNLQKIILQIPIIQFSPLSPKSMAVWLQILCLLENCFLDKESLTELLQWNRGDIRRTLLQLQFWIQSGGGNCAITPINFNTTVRMDSESDFTNDDNHLSIEDVKGSSDLVSSFPTHCNCISTFADKCLITLDNVWWSMLRHSKSEYCRRNAGEDTATTSIDLQDVSRYLEALSDIDRSHRRYDVGRTDELSVKNSNIELKDSTQLSEVLEGFNERCNFVSEWTHRLISGHQDLLKYSNGIDTGLPMSEDRRWRIKQRACKTRYMEIVPLSVATDKRASTLDYYPCLRTITRSEQLRFVNSKKRKNRFFNYLRNLGFHGTDSTTEIAHNILYRNSS